MGKDVIIILIIILSYKILMKYSKIIEGVNDEDDTSPEQNDGILMEIYNNTTDRFDDIMQNLSDNTIPYICNLTDKDYDSINRECVTFDPSSRPDMCKPESVVNCKHTYYNSSVDCNTFTNETECNDNISCKYDPFSAKCKENPNLCVFKEDTCNNKNFSVDLSGIKIVINLYKENSLEDIQLEDFLKDNKYITDLGIDDSEIIDMITFYASTTQINHVENVSPFIKVELTSQMNILIQETNINAIINSAITSLNSDTTNSVSLNRLIHELYNNLNSQDPFSSRLQPRTDDQLLLDNSRIYLNVLIIILYLYFYYDKRKTTEGILSDNACLNEKNPNDENICQIDNDKCIDNDTVTSVLCKNKIGSECLTDSYCEIQAGWTICEPGKKLIDNSCVDLSNDEYLGMYKNNGDLITKGALDSYQSDTDTQHIFYTDNIQKCYMGEEFSMKNNNQIDIFDNMREKPTFNNTKLGDSSIELPRKNVNIFGTVPNSSEDYHNYYKNSMCVSCFDKDIINDINKDFRKDKPSDSDISNYQKSNLCGAEGYFLKNSGDEKYSECKNNTDKTSCNNNSYCEWNELNDLLINIGKDDGICVSRCPKTYYSENDGQCIKTSDNSFPVQTSSLYKKCKNLGEVQCQEDRDCKYYDNIERCFPNSDDTTNISDTLKNHIYSLYDMLGTNNLSFTYSLLNPTDKSGFTDNGVILDNFDLPIMDDEVPCWYLGKVYDYSSKTCRDCPENTVFRAKEDYSDGECVNELTYDELLNTIDDTLTVYENYPDMPSGNISPDVFLNTYYINKVACIGTSKSNDGLSDWSSAPTSDQQLGKQWYKPNCNFEGEPKECITTDVSDEDGVRNCLSKIGCKIIGDPDNFTCVPTEDNKVDLTLKDIGYEYFRLLNPTSPTTPNAINDYITSWTSWSAGLGKDITNRKELCDYNGSHGTCQTCYDEETMIDNSRTEDGKGCIETCEPDEGSNIDANTNFNIPYKSVTNKCSAWGDKYEENMNKYWPSVRLNDKKVSLDIINDPNAPGHTEKVYVLFMDIKTNVAFIDLIRQFERQYLPHVIFSDDTVTDTDTKIDTEKDINTKAYIAQNKKVRIPWQPKDGRILKSGISTPLRSDTRHLDNIQIKRPRSTNKYFNLKDTKDKPVFPDEKNYYTPVNGPFSSQVTSTDTPSPPHETCFTLCNDNDACDLVEIEDDLCKFYNNVPEETIGGLATDPAQGTVQTHYRKDYPTISKSAPEDSPTEDSQYLNTGTFFSGLDFLSSNLCGYGYVDSNTPITGITGITAYLNGKPFNFYNKSEYNITMAGRSGDASDSPFKDYITQIRIQENAAGCNGSGWESGRVTSSYYSDAIVKTGKYLYTLTPQTLLSDESYNKYKYFYPKNIRDIYGFTLTDQPTMSDDFASHMTAPEYITEQNIFLMPENDILYYLDKTNKDPGAANDPGATNDEYGFLLPTITDSQTSAAEELNKLKDIKYIDRRRLSIKNDDSEDPSDNFIYPLLNNTIAYDDVIHSNYEIDDSGVTNVFNFLSDSVDNDTQTKTSFYVKYFEGSSAGEDGEEAELNIMTERFIYLRNIIETDLEGLTGTDGAHAASIQINPSKNYIKYRTVFDILLNYCPLSGLPGVSLTQSKGDHSRLKTPPCIQIHYIYSYMQDTVSLQVEKYSNSLEVYFINYLLMKHMVDYDANYNPYWVPHTSNAAADSNQRAATLQEFPNLDSGGSGNYVKRDDILNVLKNEDGTYGNSFFSYTDLDPDIFTDRLSSEPIDGMSNKEDTLINVINWMGQEGRLNTITLWETISHFILFYGFLDFLIGDRADEILDEIIIKKCTDIPCVGEKKPYIRDTARNKPGGIKYYVDQLIDYTYEMLSEYLETSVYIGDKNRMNITGSDLESCKKKGDNIVGCEKYFYQIIPYRKEKIYTNRSFIEIMKENTINDTNGLTLSIFMNDYVDDIMKDFRVTSHENILNRYTPLRYPIPETLNQKTFTVTQGGSLLIGLKVSFSSGALSGNNVFSQLLLGVNLPTENNDVTINYSQLVDLFRSGNIIDYSSIYENEFKKSYSPPDSSDTSQGKYYDTISTRCGTSLPIKYRWDDGHSSVGSHFFYFVDDDDTRDYSGMQGPPCRDNAHSAIKIPKDRQSGEALSQNNWGTTEDESSTAAYYATMDKITYGTPKDVIDEILTNYKSINKLVKDKLETSKYIDGDGNIVFEDGVLPPSPALYDRLGKYTQVTTGDNNQYPLPRTGLARGGRVTIIGNLNITTIEISLYETTNDDIVNYGLYNSSPRAISTAGSSSSDYLTLSQDQPDFPLSQDTYKIFKPNNSNSNGDLTHNINLSLIDEDSDEEDSVDSHDDDYYTKTSILNKMVEICNTPSDPHPTPNSNTNPINPSQNTGLLQAFFDDNDTNEFNTLTNKGKYFSNITKNDIECVKLKDLYDISEETESDYNMYDYCQIVDPQCQNHDDNGCNFKTTTMYQAIIYRGDDTNTSEQSESYIFTSLQDISNKINNLVYNIYDYVQESSNQDTGLDTFDATCTAPYPSNSEAVATCAGVTELDTPDACVNTSVTPSSGADGGPMPCIYDINDTINDYCKNNCQRIIPDTSNYKDEEGNPLSPSAPWPLFNLRKTEYDTYNNNELTYIDYTEGKCVRNKEAQLPIDSDGIQITVDDVDDICRLATRDKCTRNNGDLCEYIFPHTINEHKLNNYKNYDVSENIFTNIYSYNANNCKRIDGCDIDNIKVFDVQHSDTTSDTTSDPIAIKKLEHFDRVWPKTPNSAGTDGGSSDYDPKDIYKCSRYCAINETCESIPDIAYSSRYDEKQKPNDYKNDDSDPLGRANSKFDNIFSQTNMANINPGHCPPFTKNGADGKCVYYTEGEGTNTAKIYDYNGGEIDTYLSTMFGDAEILRSRLPAQISESCDLKPKTFQENIELFHACEEWYLQPTNNPDKPDQTNLDKCMSDISQGGNTMNSKNYSIPDLNLKVEGEDNNIVFENRNKINDRFANSGRLDSCQINDQGSEFNGQTCANFVTDYIVRENYYKTYKENNIDNEGLQKLNEYHIGPRSHNGEYVENNPIHNSIIGINSPSPLEPNLGGEDYVNKDFVGKYEYAKYVNPNNIFDQTDGSATYDEDLYNYKNEKLQPMYEQSGNTPPADSLYSNINKYITGGECAPTQGTEGTTNHWPFLGYAPAPAPAPPPAAAATAEPAGSDGQ